MSKRFKIGLGIFVFVLLVLFIVILPPRIVLNGKDNVIIDYGSVYKDSGAYASKFWFDLKVSTKGSVDTNKIGDYKVIYNCKYLFFDLEKIRTVKVVDRVAPVISLTGSEEVKVCPNKEYTEEGYSSIDNYDADVTSNVIREETSEGIKYSSIDSSGNKSVVIRKIIRKDDESPTIRLKGKETVYVYVDNKYKENGYSAYDNCDGDLTSSVKVINNVNFNKVGSYDIVYSVKDSSGNEAKVTRNVKVINKIVDNGTISNGTIYLTFDDGPSTETSRLLDILKKHNVKATFFVTSKGSDSDILRAFNEGHTIGLHSYTHVYSSVYASADAYFKDLNLISERVKRITGVESKIIRFPGGSSNTVSKNYSSGIMTYLSSEVVNKGYHYFDWNVSSGDGGGVYTKEGVYNNVVNNLKFNRANVVLMHDTNGFTVDAVEDIILFGIGNGYTFKVITMDTKMVRHSINN